LLRGDQSQIEPFLDLGSDLGFKARARFGLLNQLRSRYATRKDVASDFAHLRGHISNHVSRSPRISKSDRDNPTGYWSKATRARWVRNVLLIWILHGYAAVSEPL